MEVIKDLFIPFYERLRRPFVSAFWISWLFVNWKLWVGLLFYDETVNGVDKIQFIFYHINSNVLIIKPLIFSCLFLLTMPILDLLAFSWQEFVRNGKRWVKYHLDKFSYVRAETHLKVIEDKNEIAIKLNKLEETYQGIKSTAQKYQDDSLAHRRNSLTPTLKYFQGDWSLPDNKTPELFINFSENSISYVKKDLNTEQRVKVDLYTILSPFYKNQKLYLPVIPIFNQYGQTIENIHESVFGQDKNRKLVSELTSNVSFLLINLEDLYRNDFSFYVNGGGKNILLERHEEYNSTNTLFENDTEALMPIKDRIRPSLRNK